MTLPLHNVHGLKSFHFEEKVDPPVEPKDGDKEKKDEKPKKIVKKMELTEDDIQARIEAAVEKERKKLQKERDEEKARIDEENKKKAGEFQALYESETAKTKSLLADLDSTKLGMKRREVEFKLHQFVAKNNPDYSSSIEWMLPKLNVTLETKDDEVDAQVKGIVEQYVKDNPRSVKQGPPPPPARGKGPSDGSKATTVEPTRTVPQYLRMGIG